MNTTLTPTRDLSRVTRPITILIVDDTLLQLKYISTLLANQGYNLALARDGESALAQAAKLMPDLILLDVMMPGMDGFEVCQALRKDALLAETPVIMVTALDDQKSRLKGIEAGADDFIVKPFDHLELRARIRTLTRLNRQRQWRQFQLENALEELRRSEEKFSNLFHYSNDAIFIYDLDGYILDINQKVLAQFGYTRNDILSRQIRELNPPDALVIVNHAFEKIIDDGYVKFEVDFIRRNGKTFPAEVSASLFEIAGEPVIQGIVRDITERKQAELRLSGVLNTVSEGIITIDTSSKIVMLNREVQHIFGYTEQELIAQNLSILIPNSSRKAHQLDGTRHLQAKITKILGQRLELEGKRKDGSHFPLEICVTETKIGERLLFTAAVRDITERHQLNKMRENFVSTVSHELRTPLASIMGFTETILSGHPGPLTRIQRRFLKNSYRSSERLLKLIEELLTVSLIQQGALKLNKDSFCPLESVQIVKEMLLPLAHGKGIELLIENDWLVNDQFIGDYDRLEQVMINLISNAIKFTPEEGRICVHSYKEDENWHFNVQDTGIGVPPSDIPHLFQRFYRASNAADAQIQGSGLGLYVCKAIIEKHCGQIGLESEPGFGTRAWFKLPVQQEQLLHNQAM